MMLLVRSYKANASAVARHLKWPEAKVKAALNYAKAFPEEIEEAITQNDSTNLQTLKRMLPRTTDFAASKATRR